MEINAGVVTIIAPPDAALRVDIDDALGAFQDDNVGLQRVAGEENVWETAAFGRAANQVVLKLHIAVRAVRSITVR